MAVEMNMSTSAKLREAIGDLTTAGFRAGKGKSRMAYPNVIVALGVPDDRRDEVRSRILAIDPSAKPVTPPGSYVHD